MRHRYRDFTCPQGAASTETTTQGSPSMQSTGSGHGGMQQLVSTHCPYAQYRMGHMKMRLQPCSPLCGAATGPTPIPVQSIRRGFGAGSQSNVARLPLADGPRPIEPGVLSTINSATTTGPVGQPGKPSTSSLVVPKLT